MATNGVGYLMQLLTQDQAQRHAAAMYDAEQQDRAQQGAAAAQAHQNSLAQQLRAQMLMHAMDDQARQNTDEVNFNRSVEANRRYLTQADANDAARAERDKALAKARFDQMLKEYELKDAAARAKAKDDIELEKLRGNNAAIPRTRYGYTHSDRPLAGAGGAPPDVRRGPEYNRWARADSVWRTAKQADAAMSTASTRADIQRAAIELDAAEKAYNAKYPPAGMAQQPHPVVNIPEFLRDPAVNGGGQNTNPPRRKLYD